jgi:hypothetical protein
VGRSGNIPEHCPKLRRAKRSARRALREDQDTGSKLDSLGAGEIGEHHKRIVERVALGIAVP